MNEKIKQSTEDLILQLREQIAFLTTSSFLFDQWKTKEAKRIALHLRILLHDTNRSKSLLGQLNMKSITFLNTAKPYDPNNLVSHVALLKFRFHNPSGTRPWLVPRGTPDKLPENNRSPFEEWWNMPVLVAKSKEGDIFFSRKDIVLHAADTDGGAHVDEALYKHYVALSKWNAIGVVTIQNGVEKPIDNPILPYLRQIAHEVLITLQDYRPHLFDEPYSYISSEKPPPDEPGTGVPTPSELGFKMIN